MITFNYSTIKDLAARAKVKVTDLLALAPKNDPFYTGTPADIEQGEWFANIWTQAGYTSGVHLRAMHYTAVSLRVALPDGKPYENTEWCWDYLVQASKNARYLSLVRIEDVKDNKNPHPHVHADYTDASDSPAYDIEVPDLTDPNVYVGGISNEWAQPYHLEVWCEKSTMNDVLIPVCRRFNANLVTFTGEVSITSVYDLVRRIQASDGKPCRIWYISDFDPAGNSMPVAMSRKLEYMLQYLSVDFDVRVKPFMLTLEQVRKYRLPRIPIKETERRAGRFEDAFGTGACELDALQALYPGELSRMLTRDMQQYYDIDVQTKVQANRLRLRQAVEQQIAAITAEYTQQIAALRTMFERIERIEVNVAPFAVERAEPQAHEKDADWLFDSRREYVKQIQRYKAHKGAM